MRRGFRTDDGTGLGTLFRNGWKDADQNYYNYMAETRKTGTRTRNYLIAKLVEAKSVIFFLKGRSLNV